ncbi:hypothetical protein AOQ84DRAFT_407370 [Glonium stellatum]|uniref:Uncharacterized protein n=1 Tax=Glonium stellatum TaxID=574774 RepID=A0A8E2JSW8_9PEZI|nr:hypothetical protein AOQ84DRAFT_407370 [Glonium stellatum]
MDEKNSPTLSNHRDVLKPLRGREPSNKFEMQAALEEIRSRKGNPNEKISQHLRSIDDREIVEEFLRQSRDLRETTARYTKRSFSVDSIFRCEYLLTLPSIAKQLSFSAYNFLYGLIQNADGSLYKTTPSLTFRITPSELIVETNADSFTRANVDAICEIHEPNDYTDEKIFGFKSVFAVANNVHVQSGIWSFSLKHNKGEDGLGMVTPLDAEPETLPDNVTTRITLTLTDSEQVAREKLIKAIEDIPDAIVLFLQKIKGLDIIFENPSGRIKRTLAQGPMKFDSGVVHLPHKIQRFQGSELVSFEVGESEYYLVNRTLENMPEHDLRQDQHTAIVKLAFPVDAATKKPKVSKLGQHVFTCFPLQRLPQLRFLIQSDFITTTNGEHIVDCAWNDALRDGVAKTFADAVTKFAAKEHQLRYSWLYFLPTRRMEGFWKPLYAEILESLKVKPILQSWTKGIFKKPSELLYVVPSAIYDEKPIFEDLPVKQDQYLAPQYMEEHEKAIKELGVRQISGSDILKRLEADLSRPNSRMKSLPPGDQWQISAANLLLQTFNNSNGAVQENMKRMAFIPQRSIFGGPTWTKAPIGWLSDEHKYFPSTNGIPVPEIFSLYVLETQAASVPERAALFRKLGVRDSPKEKVIQAIINYHRNLSVNLTDLSNSVVSESHYEYLFHFHENPELLRDHLYFPTEAGYLRPASDHFYFLSDGEYDTQKLLGEGCEKERNGPVAFISKTLFDFVSPTIRSQGLSWVEWLAKASGARYFPPLIDSAQASTLSRVMVTVLDKNPEKRVEVLHAHWDAEYKFTILKQPWVSSIIKEYEVLCESNRKMPLKSTYLLAGDIRAEFERLGIGHWFPVLKLPVALNMREASHWQFLEHLGVRYRVSLEFYLSLLADLKSLDKFVRKEVVGVYTSIAKIAQLDRKDHIREFFTTNTAVYCPHKDTIGTWRIPDNCVWAGPSFLTSKGPLKPYYDHEPNLAEFFRAFLGVRDATLRDVLDELAAIRYCATCLLHEDKLSKAAEIYQYLHNNYWSDDDLKLIRQEFSQRELIITPEGWRTSSSCLWVSPPPTPGYEAIWRLYPSLGPFFVNGLRIKTASISMLVTELAKLVKEEFPPMKQVRELVMQMGMLISLHGFDANVGEAMKDLQKLKFLPMKLPNNSLVLKGIDDDFAILDHARFGNALKLRSVVLDFSLEESQALDALFRALGLVDRYLSNAVKEISTIGDGAVENPVLTKEMKEKAYALYCCATKFKSPKTLHRNTNLFEQLSNLQICTSNNISTNLVLDLKNEQSMVKSNRIYVYSTTLEGKLIIYLPKNHREQKICYRSQLPGLFREILGISSLTADFPLSLILGSELEVLDDIMEEQDIPPVHWVTIPPRKAASPSSDRPVTPNSMKMTGNSQEFSFVVPSFSISPKPTTPLRQDSGTVALLSTGSPTPKKQAEAASRAEKGSNDTKTSLVP